MQSYKLEVAPIVVEEIREIALFIAQDSVVEALKWADYVEEKIQSLASLPFHCPVAEESQHFPYEIHHLIIGNYRVLFRIDDKTVKVLHVRSGRMARKP
jgi:plasmid stabilization system protein ParE